MVSSRHILQRGPAYLSETVLIDWLQPAGPGPDPWAHASYTRAVQGCGGEGPTRAARHPFVSGEVPWVPT